MTLPPLSTALPAQPDPEMKDRLTQQLADHLHYLHCTWNHTDGCGYGYHTWDKRREWDESDARERAELYGHAFKLITVHSRERIRDYLSLYRTMQRQRVRIV